LLFSCGYGKNACVIPKNFFGELKRRNVYKVAVAYGVVAWLTIQAASIFLPAFNAPLWGMQIIILLLVVGFPIALVFSWAFEITPEGIKRESQIEPEKSITHHTGRKIVALTIVLAVIATGLFIFQFLRARSTSSSAGTFSNKSIAVLPFENLSGDPQNLYFSEGVQDEILTRLAKIAELKVISRTSTQRFKSAPNDLREIAQQLGVANILEGSVQKAGDQVRVNVQLINALTDAHLWADTYDRKLSDIFAVESEIAKTVAENLRAKLTGSAEQVLVSKPTENPEAHELYLKGRHFWNRRTEADIRKALELFQQAIGKDPSFALAYAGVADCYSILPNYTNGAPKPYVDLAIPSARRAVELDDSSAEAHTALANALGVDLQLPASEAEFQRAFALNPNYASAHQWYGEVLQSLGRFDKCLAEMRRARDLDPLSLIINTIYASALYSAGRTDEASQQVQRAFELDPNFGVAYWVRAQIVEAKGDLNKAIADYEKSKNSTPADQADAMIACIYARSGKRAEAEKILRKLMDLSKRSFVSSYALAQIHATLGNKDEAIRFLNKSFDERSIPVGGGGNGGPKIDNRFDSIRNDPRFQKLQAKFLGESQ
jgi:TolB-like protein/Flp pilus assembly protein TadD